MQSHAQTFKWTSWLASWMDRTTHIDLEGPKQFQTPSIFRDLETISYVPSTLKFALFRVFLVHCEFLS